MPSFLAIDDSSSFYVFLKKRLEQKWPDALVDIYDPQKSGKPDDDYSWNDFDLGCEKQ